MASAYRRFVSTETAPEGTHEIVLESAESSSFSDGSTRVPIINRASPALQIYDRFLNAVFDRISTHAVLHAGALVTPRGDALLIAGPSGFGKTSLTLELLCRGLGFLSDDYAPVDLSTGRVHPYPRTVGLLPDGSARTPRVFVEAAQKPELPRLLGKALIDVGDVLGEAVLATDPVSVDNVVFLDADRAEGDYPSVVHLGVWHHGISEAAGMIEEALGADVLERTDRKDITIWRIGMRLERMQTERFSDLLDRDFVAFHETLPGSTPEFEAEPRLTPIRPRDMALLLCREIQNRRRRGALMQAYNGDTTRLFLDVASALSRARCYRLNVGNFESTANLLEQLART
jgi:hypothetical protein